MFLSVDSQAIQWRPEAEFTLDVAGFEQGVQEAQKAANAAAARQALMHAIQHYGGDLLPGCYEDWIIPLRERLQQTYAHALEQMISILESQQDYSTAIDYAQRLLHHDPLRELTYCRLMQLYALAGDRAAALRVYHTCTSVLARELGVDPDPTTRSIYEHLLNLEAPQPIVSHLRDDSPLIGREQAWVQLQEAWRKAARGAPTFVLVGGEAGIGKTRLAEELIVWARRQGIAAVVAHCYAAGGNLALSPVQEWLRAPAFRRARQEIDGLWASEAARLLPELLAHERPLGAKPAAPILLTEAWQRQRLFEALARLALYSGEPLLLLLDDIQWCDTDTLEWMQYLLHFNSQARLMLVGTMRREELANTGPLAAFVLQANRLGLLVEIELERLSPQETTQLAINLLGHPLQDDQAQWLYAQSEGNPLFVVETVRAELATEDDKVTRWQGDKVKPRHPLTPSPPHPLTLSPLPPKVLAVVQSRLGRLSPQALDLACVAAVIGRAFTIDVLAQASESDEDNLVRSLDELWRQRIIREGRGNGLAGEAYDFTHDKIREVAYASLSPILRRFLHRRVARALTATDATDRDSVKAQIANHYEHAGQAVVAIDFYQQAAQVAHHRSAFNEAIDHLHRALALLDEQPQGDAHSRQELAIQAALGPLLLATKGYAASEVEQAFTRAWMLCQLVGNSDEHFRVLWGLGRFYFVQPNPAKCLEAAQQLLALAQQSEDSGLLVEAHCSLGTHFFHQALFIEARHHLEQALALYDRQRHSDHTLVFGQDPGVVSHAYLAWTLWCLGESSQALAQTEAALALAEAINHPYSQVIATTYASVQQHYLNDPVHCLDYANTAIRVAKEYGFTLWQSMVTFLRGWAHTMAGDFDNGFSDMQQSIDLFRETGAELGAAYFVALLAETLGRFGQPEAGLIVIDEAFATMERTQDRWCEAEIHRLRGELLQQSGDTAEAIVALQNAITIAKAQQANQWEARAVESLTCLQEK
jgi:predicted ATPase